MFLKQFKSSCLNEIQIDLDLSRDVNQNIELFRDHNDVEQYIDLNDILIKISFERF